jgi:hypothetical protein
MRFVRVTVDHDAGEVVGVTQQDTPFESNGGAVFVIGADGVKHRCQTFDLGVVEEHDWRDAAGNVTHPARHIFDSLERARIKPEHFTQGTVTAEHAGVRELLDCPCTHEGIRDRLRSKGTAGIHVKVRAWLVLTLPPHHVDALGLDGVSIAALKAMERIRNERDPRSGSRMANLERIAQQRSDTRAARHLARRRAKEE